MEATRARCQREVFLMIYGLSANFAGGLVGPFLSAYIYELSGGRFLQTGIVSQVPSALSVVMSYLWATLSDRSGRRKVFVQVSVAASAATYLMLSFVERVDQLLLVQLVGAVVGSMGGAAFSAFIAESFRENRGRVLGRYSASSVTGSFLGNLASGFLYSTINFRNMLRIASALNLVPLAVLSLFPEERASAASQRKRLSLKIPRKFWRLYGARVAMTLPGSISGGVFAIYYLKYLGGSPESWSLVSAITTLLGLASIPYGKLADRVSAKRMFTLAGLGWTLLYLGYYLSSTPQTFAAFFVVPVWPAFWLAYNKAMMEVSDTTERAKLYAFEGMLSAVYSSAVGLAASYLADSFGPRNLFLISTLAAAIATLCTQVVLE